MMKKVTMLVMAMALVVPVLGYFEDNPPAWDAGENTATATWDFSTMDGAYADEMPPTCLEGTSAYMTCFAPENHDGDIGELLVGDSIGASIWYNVGVPDVEGAYITIRTQLFLAEGSDERDFAESKYSYDIPTAPDEFNCFQGSPVVEVVEGVMYITQTIDRYIGECESGIVAAGSWVPATDEGIFVEYTAVIVDIIVHDEEAFPEGGPRETGCFADPTITIDGAEIFEEGATSADLTIQLYKNAPTDVTFTIAGPLLEADPNFADPEAFFIDGFDGAATVVVPADNNSVTFTVTAFDDEVIEGTLGYQLAVESTMAAGPGYDPNLVTGDTAVLRASAVTVIDNDVRKLVIDNPFANEDGILQLTENDPNVWYPVDVKLSHEPAPGTVVNVDLDIFEWGWDMGMVETDGDLDDPNALTFDETDWNIAQTISFAAIDNEVLAEVGVFELEAVCSLEISSDDPTYQELPGQNIIITIEEKACGGRGFDYRDINEDCYVNVEDLAIFVENWLNCTDRQVEGCIE